MREGGEEVADPAEAPPPQEEVGGFRFAPVGQQAVEVVAEHRGGVGDEEPGVQPGELVLSDATRLDGLTQSRASGAEEAQAHPRLRPEQGNGEGGQRAQAVIGLAEGRQAHRLGETLAGCREVRQGAGEFGNSLLHLGPPQGRPCDGADAPEGMVRDVPDDGAKGGKLTALGA